MENLVSVIIPAYNAETYISKCINSIIQQSYKRLEIILIDDGSIDGTLQLCEEYAQKDERIVVLHQENTGQAIARNNALNIAKGEYIMFVDSDDRLDERAIEIMLNLALKENSQLVICGAYFDNGDSIKKGLCYDKVLRFTTEEILKAYFTTHYIQVAPWGKLYYKDLFLNNRFPPFRAREDYFIMHRLLAEANNVVHCGERLYYQYVREGSTENSCFNENKLHVIECDQEIIKYVKKNHPSLYEFVRFNLADAILNCMRDIIFSFQYKQRKSLYKKLTQDFKLEIKKMKSENAGIKHKHKVICNCMWGYRLYLSFLAVMRRAKKRLNKRCKRTKGEL